MSIVDAFIWTTWLLALGAAFAAWFLSAAALVLVLPAGMIEAVKDKDWGFLRALLVAWPAAG